MGCCFGHSNVIGGWNGTGLERPASEPLQPPRPVEPDRCRPRDTETRVSVLGSPCMIKLLLSRRIGNLVGFLVCAGMLAFGYHLQFVVGLEPCPLCIIQRILLFAVGVAFLVAALHHPVGWLGAGLYGGIIASIAVIGVAVAGRHVWLEHLPPEERPACGPALDYLLSAFGPVEGLSRVLRGSGECGVVEWTLLSFSIPEWTLAAFLALAVWAVFLAPRN
jgi:disulfide bond formation protein DsbB